MVSGDDGGVVGGSFVICDLFFAAPMIERIRFGFIRPGI
jgi:hypothetical protein